MNMSIDGAFIYFEIPILGGIPITQTTVSSLLVTIFLCVASVMLGRNLKKRPDGVQVMVEKGVMMLQNMVVESMGAHNVHWTPFIGTIFLSSIFGSFIGLTGFLRSSTADISCTMVWAIMVSVIIWYNNIKNNGFVGWLKGFTEPIVVMTPMNIVGEIAQPVSMGFRHFGNVAGGGVITSILYTALGLLSSALIGLVSGTVVVPIAVLVLGIGLFVWGRKTRKAFRWIIGIVFGVVGLLGLLENLGVLSDVPIFQFGIPAVLSVYFDLFSGFVQALVFSLLSMVYIAGSCPAPEAEQA